MGTKRPSVGTGLLSILMLAALCAAGCTAERRMKHFNETAADAASESARVVDALEIRTGDAVADLGAGGGYFTFMLAPRVGAGIVYAVDVNDRYLAILAQELAAKKIANVKLVKGEFDDSRLPSGSIDLVFARNVFHEIENQPAYFARLKTALKPGGRVAIIDYTPDRGSVFFTADAIITFMKKAGYRVQKRFDFPSLQSFIIFTPDNRQEIPHEAH
jgi:arsenite methyltransferase